MGQATLYVPDEPSGSPTQKKQKGSKREADGAKKIRTKLFTKENKIKNKEKAEKKEEGRIWQSGSLSRCFSIGQIPSSLRSSQLWLLGGMPCTTQLMISWTSVYNTIHRFLGGGGRCWAGERDGTGRDGTGCNGLGIRDSGLIPSSRL